MMPRPRKWEPAAFAEDYQILRDSGENHVETIAYRMGLTPHALVKRLHQYGIGEHGLTGLKAYRKVRAEAS